MRFVRCHLALLLLGVGLTLPNFARGEGAPAAAPASPAAATAATTPPLDSTAAATPAAATSPTPTADAAAAAPSASTATPAAPANSATPAAPADANIPNSSTPAAGTTAAAGGTATKPAEGNANEEKAEGGVTLANEANKSAGIAKLVKKLSTKDGKPAKIILLSPIDYTTLDFSELASTNIQKTLLRYGKFNIETEDYHLPSLTLEQFRKVIIKTKADIVFVTVLKPTNFDLFMYDKKTPYYIYAHSEVLPENIQYKLTKDLVTQYSRLLLRRTLYSFIEDQYYELPREESQQFMHTDVPRWIATSDSLAVVNHDINSNYFISLGYGGALVAGNGGGWTSDVFSGNIGVRVYQDFYVDIGLDSFAYNAFNVSALYGFIDRDSPFRYYLGFGLAMAVNQHTIDFDRVFSQAGSNAYAMGTGIVTFPILDIWLKLEGRLYFGVGQSTTIFSVTPGIMVLF